MTKPCSNNKIEIDNKCISRQVFLNKLVNRENKKVGEILKNDRQEVLKDVKRVISSGAVDTKQIWEEDNYIFARVIASQSSGKIAIPDTSYAKELKRNLKYF
ncbi:MAG: hypothetical protein AABY22_16895 [Nanoarchaeota archaeon]